MGGCNENREFLIFFNYCSCTTPFFVLMVHCPGLSLWATPRKRPQSGDWGQAPHWCALTCFPWDPFFLRRVKGGQSPAAGMGAAGLGGLNKRQAQKFLPETAACSVTPLFLQIRIVYTLINKLYLGLAGWHISTMEIISVREKMCAYVKQF